MLDKRRAKQKPAPGLVPGVSYGRGSMGSSKSVSVESIPIAVWFTAGRMNGLANWMFVVCTMLALYAAFQWVSRSAVFGLRNVVVTTPLKHVDEAVLVAQMRSLRGDLFSVNLDEARANIAKLSWVRHVDVRRAFPDRMFVSIEEHEPIGRWGTEGLINTYGELFDADHRGDLPRLSGPTASEREVLDFYQRSKSALAVLGLTPVSVTLSPRRAWRVSLDNGLELELGREQIDDRLAVFARAYPTALAQLSNKTGVIDLRYDGGFVLKNAIGNEILTKDPGQGRKG